MQTREVNSRSGLEIKTQRGSVILTPREASLFRALQGPAGVPVGSASDSVYMGRLRRKLRTVFDYVDISREGRYKLTLVDEATRHE